MAFKESAVEWTEYRAFRKSQVLKSGKLSESAVESIKQEGWDVTETESQFEFKWPWAKKSITAEKSTLLEDVTRVRNLVYGVIEDAKRLDFEVDFKDIEEYLTAIDKLITHIESD